MTKRWHQDLLFLQRDVIFKPTLTKLGTVYLETCALSKDALLNIYACYLLYHLWYLSTLIINVDFIIVTNIQTKVVLFFSCEKSVMPLLR